MATQLLQLPPESLHPNPWNTNIVPPDGEAKIDASVKRFGMFKPIIVREVGGQYQIIGGAHRRDSAIRLGMASVPVINLGPIDDVRAKEIGLVDNGRYGNDDTIALAQLLEELGSPAELGEFLPYSDTDFASIFSSVNIALDDLDLPDDDGAAPALPKVSLPQTHQLMRYKVPVDDAATVTEAIAKVMKSQGFTEEDSLSNAGNALVYLIRKAMAS